MKRLITTLLITCLFGAVVFAPAAAATEPWFVPGPTADEWPLHPDSQWVEPEDVDDLYPPYEGWKKAIMLFGNERVDVYCRPFTEDTNQCIVYRYVWEGGRWVLKQRWVDYTLKAQAVNPNDPISLLEGDGWSFSESVGSWQNWQYVGECVDADGCPGEEWELWEFYSDGSPPFFVRSECRSVEGGVGGGVH